jgi:16S rRNA (cytosine967-C5)-methyltransferase
MWLRVNPARIDPNVWRAQLQASGIAAASAHPTIPTAVVLDAAVSVDQLPGFAAGDVSVQDAASQLAAPLLDTQPGMRVLDACAAPGGKTTHILERCPNLAELVAVDQSEARLQLIRGNLQRLGLSATLRRGDASEPDSWWDGVQFDRILVDAPCSATGVIRRHPDIAYLRREGDLPRLAATQLRLLEQLWPLLKPGGRMLYSTCSLLREENSAVVAAMLGRTVTATSLASDVPLGPEAIRDNDVGLQLLPGVGGGDTDGFYYALMEREPDSTP